MEIQGSVIAVLPAQSGVSQKSGKQWMSQEYVIEIADRYPRHMVFSVFGEDKIKAFNIQMGEYITVSFDVDAREYKGRWYNSIQAWKVQRPQAAPQPQAVPRQNALPANDPRVQQVAQALGAEPVDDLPF